MHYRPHGRSFGTASSSRFLFRANRNPKLELGLGYFDLLSSGSVHADVLP